jgi:hypothetical protein
MAGEQDMIFWECVDTQGRGNVPEVITVIGAVFQDENVPDHTAGSVQSWYE